MKSFRGSEAPLPPPHLSGEIKKSTVYSVAQIRSNFARSSPATKRRLCSSVLWMKPKKAREAGDGAVIHAKPRGLSSLACLRGPQERNLHRRGCRPSGRRQRVVLVLRARV